MVQLLAMSGSGEPTEVYRCVSLSTPVNTTTSSCTHAVCRSQAVSSERRKFRQRTQCKPPLLPSQALAPLSSVPPSHSHPVPALNVPAEQVQRNSAPSRMSFAHLNVSDSNCPVSDVNPVLSEL